MQLDALPRESFVGGPTPLQPMPRLSEALGGPTLWVKRDDCTALVGGGNKARKLEFLLAEARAQGADTVVTFGAVQSNHVRMTAAAARRIGMEPVLVLSGAEPETPTGNLLLDRVLGARTVFVPDYREEGAADAAMQIVGEAIAGLHADGRNVYMIPVGGSTPLGDCGYVAGLLEIQEQTEAEGFTPAAVVTAVGTAGTYAGLLAGTLLREWNVRIHGVAVDTRDALDRYGQPPVHDIVPEIGALLDTPLECGPELVHLDYDYVGAGYGIPTAAGVEAIRLVAQTEGLILDPVYTGKAMAGLIGAIRQGAYAEGDHVIFLHTGGLPGLFPHAHAVL